MKTRFILTSPEYIVDAHFEDQEIVLHTVYDALGRELNLGEDEFKNLVDDILRGKFTVREI